MPENNISKQKLEEAVLEYRRLTCPNIECDDMIISRERVTSSHSSQVEYWCRSKSCCYHQKSVIHLLRPANKSNSNTLSISTIGQQFFAGSQQKQMLFIVAGILVFWFIFTSYHPRKDVSTQPSTTEKVVGLDDAPSSQAIRKK